MAKSPAVFGHYSRWYSSSTIGPFDLASYTSVRRERCLYCGLYNTAVLITVKPVLSGHTN